MLSKSKFVLPTIAEVVLNDVRQNYKQNKKFTSEALQALNSVFGETLIKAMDVLDTHKFIKYTLNSGIRCVYKLYRSHQQYVLFNNINYCTCDAFKNEILTKTPRNFTCRHILSIILADIVELIKVEVVTDSQLTDLLNNQVCAVLKYDEM